jgi:heme/copper-type cytochrome/quinol oxidase subunit 2
MLKVYDFNELHVRGDGVSQIIFDCVHSLGNYAKFDNAFILSFLSKTDEPYYKQYGFQDPATTFFEKLIDFHHDMLFLMIVVLVFVFYMLMACIFNFNQWAGSLPAADVRYNAKIETIWTVVPTLILLMVVVPAFSLIYSMDDTSSQPMFSVKIAGNQWYWTYEYIFLKPDRVSESKAVASLTPKSSFYPYVVPSKNGKHAVIFPKAWTSSSSEKWHSTNSDFQMHIHILQSSLAPIKTAQEWFDFHVKFLQAWAVVDQNPKYLKDMVSSTKFSAPLGTYLLFKQWKNNGPSFSFNRVEEWLSFNGLSNDSGFGLMRLFGVESLFFAKNSSSSGKPSGGATGTFPSSGTSSSVSDQSSNNFKMRAYSYDSTMLSEDDVLRSNGNKARLLSVDKPLYLPSNTLLTIAVTAYDVIHSWTVPSFGVKLDGCPGRSNTVSFSVKRAGLYYGQCSEICGVNHAFMPVEVRVFNITEFLGQVARWA